MAEFVNIKQIKLSDGAHDIDAKYWNGHEWSELGNPLRFLGAAQSEVPTAGRYVKAQIQETPESGSNLVYIPITTEGEPTEISAEKGDVFVIADSGLEYLCIKAGVGTEAKWTSLGDETHFQRVGKTLQTSTPSTNKSGLGGDQTITSSKVDAYEAEGTAGGTIEYSYKEADTTNEVTLANCSTSANTGEAGGDTINGSSFGFAGKSATLSGNFNVNNIVLEDHAAANLDITGTQSIAAHSHPVNIATATADILTKGASTEEAGGHTHTVTLASHLHENDVTVTRITDYTAPSMTAIKFTPNTLQTLTTKNYGFSAEQTVLSSATVSTLGVLSFDAVTAGTQDELSAGSAASLTGGVFSAGELSYTNTVAAGSKTNQTLDCTVASAGAHTHSFADTAYEELTYVTGATLNTAGATIINGSNFKAFMPSLPHTQVGTASVNVSLSYKPEGSINGSAEIAAHSHTYTAPKAHSHGISMTEKSATLYATLDAIVNIPEHSHTVQVAAHTHDLGNHTHNVTTSNN